MVSAGKKKVSIPMNTIDVIPILILLFPGLLSQGIRDTLDRASVPRTTFERVVSAAIFTLVDWFVFFIVAWILNLVGISLLGAPGIARAETITEGPEGMPTILGMFLAEGGVPIFIIAVVVGLATAAIQYYSWDLKLMYRLKLTDRVCRADVWVAAFREIKGVLLLVHLADGRRYLGWPKWYSEEPGVHELFLADAFLVKEDDTTEPVPGHGLLFIRESDILFIEFLDPKPLFDAGKWRKYEVEETKWIWEGK